MNVNHRVPLIGQQQQQQQAMVHNMVVTAYLGLVPVVAGAVLARPELYDCPENIPDRIADEAWKVTAAVVKKIGIQIGDQRPSGEKAM